MTARERALLRDMIARATTGAPVMPPERKRYRAWAVEKRRWRAMRKWRCVYCGDRIRDSRGRFEVGLTCNKHADLPALDWRYTGATR